MPAQYLPGAPPPAAVLRNARYHIAAGPTALYAAMTTGNLMLAGGRRFSFRDGDRSGNWLGGGYALTQSSETDLSLTLVTGQGARPNGDTALYLHSWVDVSVQFSRISLWTGLGLGMATTLRSKGALSGSGGGRLGFALDLFPHVRLYAAAAAWLPPGTYGPVPVDYEAGASLVW